VDGRKISLFFIYTPVSTGSLVSEHREIVV